MCGQRVALVAVDLVDLMLVVEAETGSCGRLDFGWVLGLVVGARVRTRCGCWLAGAGLAARRADLRTAPLAGASAQETVAAAGAGTVRRAAVGWGKTGVVAAGRPAWRLAGRCTGRWRAGVRGARLLPLRRRVGIALVVIAEITLLAMGGKRRTRRGRDNINKLSTCSPPPPDPYRLPSALAFRMPASLHASLDA